MVVDLWLSETDRLFWATFCPFTSMVSLKVKIFKKKTPRAIVILHQCTNHIMFGCRDISGTGYFGSIFVLLPSPPEFSLLGVRGSPPLTKKLLIPPT